MRFVLVDRIHELEPGKRIKASKVLSDKEELFRDHFPGFPIVPGVLLTEMMGQAAKKCLDARDNGAGFAVLAKINSATFRTFVRPNEEAVIHADISLQRESHAIANCYISVAGKKVCSAELMLAFVPREFVAPEYRDEVLEAYLKANPPAEPVNTEK